MIRVILWLKKKKQVAKLLLCRIKDYFYKKTTYSSMFEQIDDSVEEFRKIPKNGNLTFTLIEMSDYMVIFHGKSKRKVSERDLRAMERIASKVDDDANVNASLENDDPHLFKIVTWK